MEQITITANITARDIENAAAKIVNIYNDARQNGGRPSGTIRAAVAALGYDLTAATVATWITGKTGDGRITRRNLDFAATVPGAFTLDELRARHLYAPSDIHPAHLDQLADALREYIPEDPTPAPTESAHEDDAQTETTPAAETPAAAEIPTETAEDRPEDIPQESAQTPPASPINEELARRAKEMNSYDDYIPGSATAEYNTLCAAADEIAARQKKRTDPIHHAKIDALLSSYKKRIAEYINRSNEIDTRCPSWLVSGGSNFPTGKKAKQNAARDKNMEFYNDTQAILDKIRSVGMGGISSDDPDAAAKIEQKLTARRELQERMKAANAAIRMKDTAAGDARLAELGFTPKEIHDLRAPDFLGRVGFANFELSNNNAEIHRLEKRLADLRKRAENPLPDFTFDGGHAEANADENRLQLFFDGKPSDEIRDALKKEGFRWSPRFGAWQRQLTPNAYRAIKYAFGNLGITIHEETTDGDAAEDVTEEAQTAPETDAADLTPEQAEPEQETPEQATEPTAEATPDTIPEAETDTAPQEEATTAPTEYPETTAAPESETLPECTPWEYSDVKKAVESLAQEIKATGAFNFRIQTGYKRRPKIAARVNGHIAPKIYIMFIGNEIVFDNVNELKNWLSGQKKQSTTAQETAASSEATPDPDAPNAENALTEAERRKTSERAAEWAASVRWGLTREQLLKFISDHKTARAEGDAITTYYIEECLTEINFHTACSAINRGDYDAALADFDGKFDPDPTPADHDPANVIPFPAPSETAPADETPADAPQESAPVPETPEDRTAALIAEITAAAALIPGCKPEVKGAKTANPVIWLHGITKEHKDAAKSLGAAWAAKKSAWWITPDRYTTRREIPAE